MKVLDSKTFEQYTKEVFKSLLADETLSINLVAEETSFNRLSNAKVRQTTNITQGNTDFTFISGKKNLSFSLPYSGETKDLELTLKEIAKKREWLKAIPEDPFIVYPENLGSSHQELAANMPASLEMLNAILEYAKDVDLAGVFTSGAMVRANINSKGQFHWFKTANFCLDYSLYNEKQKAVKSLFAGNEWDLNKMQASLDLAKAQLKLMDLPVKEVPRGEYRVYLAPSAVHELLGTLSWGGMSMQYFKSGNGSFDEYWNQKAKLSDKFSLTEDFTLGLSPKFNSMGEVAPSKLELFKNGEMKNYLTSTRTSKEYNVEGNFAGEWEGLRSPTIATGNLSLADVLKELGTGIYISDLHYINWSDRQAGRVTGMTRYACFWVENGEIKAPIKDLRFDESYHNIFGEKLIDCTNEANLIVSTGTYEQRDIGGAKLPGMLLSGFKFTL